MRQNLATGLCAVRRKLSPDTTTSGVNKPWKRMPLWCVRLRSSAPKSPLQGNNSHAEHGIIGHDPHGSGKTDLLPLKIHEILYGSASGGPQTSSMLSSTSPHNKLMRHCLLRRQGERLSPTFQRRWEHLPEFSFAPLIDPLSRLILFTSLIQLSEMDSLTLLSGPFLQYELPWFAEGFQHVASGRAEIRMTCDFAQLLC